MRDLTQTHKTKEERIANDEVIEERVRDQTPLILDEGDARQQERVLGARRRVVVAPQAGETPQTPETMEEESVNQHRRTPGAGRRIVVAPPVRETPQTPKRKFSPEQMTPVGRQRKISTTMASSPELRGRFELIRDLQETVQQPQAPDLIEGIGLLTVREPVNNNNTNQATAGEDVMEQFQQPRNILRAGFRRRAQSIASSPGLNQDPGRTRGRTSSLSLNQRGSPARQLRITDIFLSQDKNLESLGDTRDVYDAKNLPNKL